MALISFPVKWLLGGIGSVLVAGTGIYIYNDSKTWEEKLPPSEQAIKIPEAENQDSGNFPARGSSVGFSMEERAGAVLKGTQDELQNRQRELRDSIQQNTPS